MNKSESIKNIAIALSKFQAEIQNPKNTHVNPFHKNKYAPLQDVLNLVRPLLTKHGLSILQHPSGDGEIISINTLLLHESGEWIEFAPLCLKAEKATPQGAGSAITYGRRYSISAVLGIASEDDDDANASEQGNKNQGRGQPNGSGGQPKKLSDAQVKRLFAIAKGKGFSEEQVKASVKKDYQKNSPYELTKQEYDELCKRLESASGKAG